ncbi:PREDICTED: mucin-21-like [Camelina sativa]|uniref:Mucin-21-like n=1 Tax=Camelina sativa TaxID=90675 RepID=A0ABM1RM81_CAMSA|nr:PREDICTED: mucin-21-like [Camelina sativa]
MARVSLGICLMLVVASSVIYEAQGTFLLKLYLRKNFPKQCNEFTPYANKGMLSFVTNLEGNCPATAEFKNFFTQFKSYMSFIETAWASSKNVDTEMTTKCNGLFKAMSAISSGKGEKSADAGGLKATMLAMGKTLVEQKKNTKIMTLTQKKELIGSMVKWTNMLATFVKSASEKKGKSIDIGSYGLDVDVNDSSIVGNTESSSASSTKAGSVSTKTKESSSGASSAASKTKESSGASSGGANKDTTGKNSGSPSETPNAKPSKGSESATEDANAKGSISGKSSFSANSATKTTNEKRSKSSSQSSFKSSSTISVKQVESETSKEVMSFITQLEKKYSAKTELKVFFEKLKASMQASSSIASKTSKDYVSATAAATGKLSEAMALVGSKNVKSAKMKSNMETSKDEMMKCLKQIQDINSKIVSGKTASSTQQSELKQTITKWEKVTTQFVETAASSSSSSSLSSSATQQQGSARMVENN